MFLRTSPILSKDSVPFPNADMAEKLLFPVTNPVLQVVGNSRYPTMPSGQKMASWAGALQGIAGQNTSSSAKQAEELRTWQEKQAEVARKYNSQEAQKNRDWQERMSSTAHQQEVS